MDVKSELQAIRTSVDSLCENVQDLEMAHAELRAVSAEVCGLIAGIGVLEENIDILKTRVRQRFENLEVELKQSDTWLRNHRLENPMMPIEPLVIWDPVKGMEYPDPKLFPKNAKEFYALRTSKTCRHRRMLSYLISFYGVELPVAAPATHGSSPLPGLEHLKLEGDHDDTRDSAHIAVQALADMFGLWEENFVSFSERAEEWAEKQPVAAKRKSTSSREEPL